MPYDIWSRRDSYPPTQIRLSRHNKNEPRPLLEDIDENPLTYFLTPSDLDNDMDNFGSDEMLFDAGIEDTNHPRELVRSVSPSTLDGLSKLRAKAVSPDFDSDVVTTDEEDDEDYLRFAPPSKSLFNPFKRSSRGLSAESLQLRSKSLPFGQAKSDGFLALAASFPSPSPSSSSSSSFSPSSSSRTASRGRPRQALTRSYSAGSKVPHRPLRLWREPSLDVWSISEETEEDLLFMETSVSTLTSASTESSEILQGPAVKPKKRVRFLLPSRD